MSFELALPEEGISYDWGVKESEIGKVYYKRLSEYLGDSKGKFIYCDEISILDAENGEIVISTNESNIGLVDFDYKYYLSVLENQGIPFLKMFIIQIIQNE